MESLRNSDFSTGSHQQDQQQVHQNIRELIGQNERAIKSKKCRFDEIGYSWIWPADGILFGANLILAIISLGSWYATAFVRLIRIIWGLISYKCYKKLRQDKSKIRYLYFEAVLRGITMVLYFFISVAQSYQLPHNFCTEFIDVRISKEVSCTWQAFGFRIVFMIIYAPIEVICFLVVRRNTHDLVQSIKLKEHFTGLSQMNDCSSMNFSNRQPDTNMMDAQAIQAMMEENYQAEQENQRERQRQQMNPANPAAFNQQSSIGLKHKNVDAEMLPSINGQKNQGQQPMYEVDQQVYNDDDYDDESYYDSENDQDSDQDDEEAKEPPKKDIQKEPVQRVDSTTLSQQKTMSHTNENFNQPKKDDLFDESVDSRSVQEEVKHDGNIIVEQTAQKNDHDVEREQPMDSAQKLVMPEEQTPAEDKQDDAQNVEVNQEKDANEKEQEPAEADNNDNVDQQQE